MLHEKSGLKMLFESVEIEKNISNKKSLFKYYEVIISDGAWSNQSKSPAIRYSLNDCSQSKQAFVFFFL